jgi:hypothetical protein
MKAKTAGCIRTVGATLLVVTLTGCGGVEGNYACEGGLLDSVQLKSGAKACVTMSMFGQKLEKAGAYTVDGDKVNVLIDGDSMLFTSSGKTLNGGEMYGTCTP